MKTSELFCPSCHRPMEGTPEETVTCTGCRKSWPVVLGIPAFSDPDFYYGEIPREGMRSALALGPERIDEVRARLAEAGPWLPQYTFDASRADWRVALGVPHGARVLDYGCGLGAVSMGLAPHFGTVCASDPTPERAAFLNLRARAEDRSNVTAVAADIDTLPFPKGSFDVVVIMGVLEWTPLSFPNLTPREAELAQLRRLTEYLVPGGTLVLGIENRIGIRYFMGGREEHIDLPFVTLMPRRIADAYTRFRGKGSYRNWTYSPAGTTRLLADAGLLEPEAYGVYFHYSFPDLVYPMTLDNAQAAKLGGSLGAATNEHWRSSRIFPAIRTGLERSKQFRKLAPSLLNRARAPGGSPSTMGLGARVHEVVLPARHELGTPMRTLRFRPDGMQMTLRSRDEASARHLRRVERLLRDLGRKPWLPELRALEEDGPDVVVVFRYSDGQTLYDRMAADPDSAGEIVKTVSAALVEISLHDARSVPGGDAAEVAKELGTTLGVDTGALVDRFATSEAAACGFAHRSVDCDRVVCTDSGWTVTDWDDMGEQILPLDGVADLVLSLRSRLALSTPLASSELWKAALETVAPAFGELSTAGLILATLRRATAREDATDEISGLIADFR